MDVIGGDNEEPLHQDGTYQSWVNHYGIPPEHADNGDNHVFVQFWHYETASYAPYDGDPAEGAGHYSPPLGHDDGFIHDADWEMAQFSVQLCDVERVNAKAGWLLPHGATASQHYYGQTLAWRNGEDGSGWDDPEPQPEIQRHVIHADDNGYRFNLYVSENAHATYFRGGRVYTGISKTSQPSPGTQVQYEEPEDRQDATQSPYPLGTYGLLPLIPKDGAGIYDWAGHWGNYHKTSWVPIWGKETPRGPEGRSAGEINLTGSPAEFFDTCRKLVDDEGDFDEDGDPDPLTILLESDGSPLEP